MTLDNLQKRVNDWIENVGGGYFDIKTNTIILMEEVGEFSSIVARKYGEQVAKAGDKENLKDEIGDILWVLTCIANQSGLSLEEIITENLLKKDNRDKKRFQ